MSLISARPVLVACSRLGRLSRQLTTVSGTSMTTLVSKCNDPFVNLAFEDWLMNNQSTLGPTMLLWRNRRCVVVGRHQNPWLECNLSAMEDRGIDLVRRKSGGGTVYHDLGNVNISFITNREDYKPQHNCEILRDILKAGWDLNCDIGKRHDLFLDGRKISGSAFHLLSKAALHHCTMLLSADLEDLRACLRVSRPGMISRGIDSVRGPVVNLTERCNISFETFVNQTFYEQQPVWVDPEHESMYPGVRAEADNLMDWSWRFGKTPNFVYSIDKEFSWGTVALEIHSQRCKITDVTELFVKACPPKLEPDIIRYLQSLSGQNFSRAGLTTADATATKAIQDVHAWLHDLIEV